MQGQINLRERPALVQPISTVAQQYIHNNLAALATHSDG